MCTVIGFPNGYATTRVKAFEAACAVEDGAEEIDMVTNIGYIKEVTKAIDSQDAERLKTFSSKYVEDIAEVCRASKGACVKCIIEAGALTDEEIAIASLLWREARSAIVEKGGSNPQFIKTSTGFNGYGGATVNAVKIMRLVVGTVGGKVKASGGVGTMEQARVIVDAGAERIGASKGKQIVDGGGKSDGSY